jgi:hypothetical protein
MLDHLIHAVHIARHSTLSPSKKKKRWRALLVALLAIRDNRLEGPL